MFPTNFRFKHANRITGGRMVVQDDDKGRP